MELVKHPNFTLTSKMNCDGVLQKDSILSKRSASMIEKDPIRSKRSRQQTFAICEEDEGGLQNVAHKRHCCEATTFGSDDHINKKSSVAFGAGNYESEINDLEVNGEIVPNFDTISFNTPKCSQSSSPSKRDTFPSFPPLRRSGRKIDHLVDEVIRKSSRINPEYLQVSLPRDFEFQMPHHVSVSGSPTTDSRFLTNPDSRNLSQAAIHAATVYTKKRKNSDSPFAKSSPQRYHLGDITHSDWFEDSYYPSNYFENGTRSFQNTNNAVNYDTYNDSDDDCDDMYVDS